MKKQQSTAAIMGLAAVLVLSACSSDGSNVESEGGDPVTGGTLKILGTADIDHLSPTGAALVSTNNLMRAVSRQLVSYEASTNETERIALKGDLAEEVPEPSEDGLTYTYKIRDGASWDAPDGSRQITSEDVERGFMMLCNPILPAYSASFFTSLIVGLDSFCEGFSAVDAEADAVKQYIEGSDVEGIDSSDETTVVIKLTERAGDFNYMLSLPAASPVPVEALAYEPDSPEYRDNFVSSGPYTVSSYVPDKSLSLARNPSWDSKSDPLRAAYVDQIELTFGLQGDSVMQQLQSGDGDMFFDITISPAILQQLTAADDKKLLTVSNGVIDPFLWINTKTTNNNSALQDLRVRQALQYAVDKVAVVQQLGGPEVANVQNGIFGPGVLGYEDSDPYPTPGSKGDPDKAKELLAEAGHADGLTLKMPYRTQDAEPAIAQTLQASLKKAGITVELVPVTPADYYSKFLTNRDGTANGDWDIAPVSWNPSWAGGAARSVFQPQFSFDGTPQTYNYVDYNNEEANEAASKAIAATDPQESASYWQEVNRIVMADAIVVPLAAPKVALYHSARVKNFEPWALGVQADWTQVWLDQ